MAELLRHARQTAPLFPRDIPDDRLEGSARRRGRRSIASVKISEGPGLDWPSNPGPPAVTVAWRRAVQQSLYACSPRCCPAPGGRAGGRCRRRFGSLIVGAAAGAFAYAARVTEAKSTAGGAAPSSVGRRICERPERATKRLAVARTYTRTGSGGTGAVARRGGARKPK